MPFLSPYNTKSVNTSFDENENLDSPRASKQRGLRVLIGFGAECIRHKLDQSRTVDELDRVFGGEFLCCQREGARRDEEAFVAVSVMDSSQEFLEDGRADHCLPLIFALNNGK